MAVNLEFNPLGSGWNDLDIQAAATGIQHNYTQKIHVRVQQLNKKSFITTIAHMDDDLDLKRISRAMARAFSCSGTIIQNKEYGEVIQLSGDQRENVKAWLIEMQILTPAEAKERLILHGA